MYVPATVRLTASRKPAELAIGPETSVEPSGFRSETVPLVIPLAVVAFMLTRWLTEPVKVSRTPCPGFVVDFVTAAPPAVIVPVTSEAS